MPAGITTGVRGASLELGGETFPRSLARIAPRDYTPLGKSRGGTPAGERARKRRAAQAAFPWRDPRAACVRGLTTVRLPAFRFPYLPEASRKELLRNILEWPALDWMAWVFSPIPVTASGGRKTHKLFDNTDGPKRARETTWLRALFENRIGVNRYGRSSGPWRSRARSKRSISRSNSTKACAPRASAASPFAGVAGVASPTAPEGCRS